MNDFFKFLKHDDFALPSPLTLLPTVTLDIFEKGCMEGNACYGTSDQRVLDTGA